MLTLGINISHDSSSCLMQDGKIIYYCEEERLSRRKTHFYWPNNCKFYGIDKLKKHNITHIDYLIFTSFRRDSDADDFIIIESMIDQIRKSGVEIENCYYQKEHHHLYHAYSAFYGSGFNDAVSIVADGSGAYTDQHMDYREIESIYECNKQNITTLFKHSVIHNNKNQPELKCTVTHDPYEHLLSNSISSGSLFSMTCELFGMDHGGQAGKVMGMSSYGEITDTDDWLHEIDGNTVFTTKCINKLDSFVDTGDFKIKANIAKKVQVETERHTIRLIKKALSMSSSKNVVLSGGYFLNCVNNYKYLKAFPDINFYVDPIAYDGGTAIGACMYIQKLINTDQHIEPINTLFLGG